MASEIDHDDYEPEYSEPANTAWMNRVSRAPSPAHEAKARKGLTLLPTAKDAQFDDFSREEKISFPLSLVDTRFESSAYQAWQIEEVRRDGTAAILRTAHELELACVCFRLELDRHALLEAEPHLRRCGRALGQLTRAAARARHFMSRPESLFDES